jgi:hypothetical protein
MSELGCLAPNVAMILEEAPSLSQLAEKKRRRVSGDHEDAKIARIEPDNDVAESEIEKENIIADEFDSMLPSSQPPQEEFGGFRRRLKRRLVSPSPEPDDKCNINSMSSRKESRIDGQVSPSPGQVSPSPVDLDTSQETIMPPEEEEASTQLTVGENVNSCPVQFSALTSLFSNLKDFFCNFFFF